MIDNPVIVAYFIVVFGIGIHHSRRQRTASVYFLAGHSVGWFAGGA
jgi:Na+/proline symporter